MKNRLTPADKKAMLYDAIILSYKVGYSSSIFVGHALSFYNYDEVYKIICKYNKEHIEQGGDDLFEFVDTKTYYGFFN